MKPLHGKIVLRTVILVLLIVAIIAPWSFDLIFVPAQYQCSDPFVRLDGNFCGTPMTGLWIPFSLVVRSAELVSKIITPDSANSDLGGTILSALAFDLLAISLLLPLLSSILLIVKGDNRRRQLFHIDVCGLAAGAGMFFIIETTSYRFPWFLWGTWLFVGLTIAALILEVRSLAARKGPGQSEILFQVGGNS